MKISLEKLFPDIGAQRANGRIFFKQALFFQVMEQRQGKGITGLECTIFVTNLVLAFAFIYGPQKHEKIMPVLQASS